MKLHEYQSKQFFAQVWHSHSTRPGSHSASEAKQIAEELGGQVVVKAQVLVGGRGKGRAASAWRDPRKKPRNWPP